MIATEPWTGRQRMHEPASAVVSDPERCAQLHDSACFGVGLDPGWWRAQVAIKCADLGHWALPNHLHQDWVDRLQTEFFAQGDREREAGLVVSPLMDREKHSSLSSSQVD